MLAFPQLTTGAYTMYPIRRHMKYRTVVNVLDDGHQDIYSDTGGTQTLWELAAQGMTRLEWNAIEGLFEQTMGRWASFTFLDPVSNLVTFSGDLSQAIWTKDALVQLTQGIADPVGTMTATNIANGAPVVSGVAQALNIPQGYHYCWSAWMRSASATTATLSVSAGSAAVQSTFSVTSQWQRQFVSGIPLVGAGTGITVAIKVPVAASVELYGLQLEAQLGPSDYKFTGAASGVYSNARFFTDQLTSTAQATDVFDAVIQITTAD